MEFRVSHQDVLKSEKPLLARFKVFDAMGWRYGPGHPCERWRVIVTVSSGEMMHVRVDSLLWAREA